MEATRPPDERPRDEPPRDDAAPRVDLPPPGKPTIVVKNADTASRSRLELAVMATLAGAGLAVFLQTGLEPTTRGVALAVTLGSLLDLALVGPAVLLAGRFAAEGARLRAALACPFCKDALPDDAATGCDRPGCGAFYHPECWAEVKATYGGCAIYGCGCTTSHPVGRFALRRHVLRLLLATVLFPPKLVRRIQEEERASFREVWQRARAYQRGVTYSEGRTVLMGLVNLLLSLFTVAVIGAGGSLFGQYMRWKVPDHGPLQALFILGVFLLISVPPVFFMRLPLAAHFGWGLARLVGRIFRDELAALRRADEGTFLARLAGGLGKKP